MLTNNIILVGIAKSASILFYFKAGSYFLGNHRIFMQTPYHQQPTNPYVCKT